MNTCFLLAYVAGLQLVQRSPKRSVEEDIDNGTTTEVPGSPHEQATHGSTDAPPRRRQLQGTVVTSVHFTCIDRYRVCHLHSNICARTLTFVIVINIFRVFFCVRCGWVVLNMINPLHATIVFTLELASNNCSGKSCC